MVRTVQQDLKKYLTAYINKLLTVDDDRIIDNDHMKNILYGMRKRLKEKGAVTEKQFNAISDFMSVDSKNTHNNLMNFFNPIIGEGRTKDKSVASTLEKFFENESED